MAIKKDIVPGLDAVKENKDKALLAGEGVGQPPLPVEDLDVAQGAVGVLTAISEEDEETASPGALMRATTPIHEEKAAGMVGQEKTFAVERREGLSAAAGLITLNDLNDRTAKIMTDITAYIDQAVQGAKDEMKSIVRTAENGISAQMVGGTFNCPECGLRIQGPSLTAQIGKNQGYYEHPFDDAPRLAGQKCRLKGVKFKPPVIFLESVTPLPLTDKAQ